MYKYIVYLIQVKYNTHSYTVLFIVCKAYSYEYAFVFTLNKLSRIYT